MEERAEEFGGKLGTYEEFGWGEPVGRERWQVMTVEQGDIITVEN